ncbi:hypothetical protein OAE88_00585 [bacterium]|nr:hypothetical protein [bacterium]
MGQRPRSFLDYEEKEVLTKEEFYEDLKRDAEVEQRQEVCEQEKLHKDVEYCFEQMDDLVNDIHEAKVKLVEAMNKYGHNWDVPEVDEWV